MLTQIALLYAFTWLLAACGAAVVEVARLLTLGRLAPLLDWTGCLCFAWLIAPLAAPAWAAMRLWRRMRSSQRRPSAGW